MNLSIGTMFAVVMFASAMLAVYNYKKPFYQSFILCVLYCICNYFVVRYIEANNYNLDYVNKIYCSLLIMTSKMMYTSEIVTLIPNKVIVYLTKNIVKSGFKDD